MPSPSPELIRDLYAAAAEHWVAEGLTSHYAMVPATDPELVDAWFRLGFGHQHVHAIRETPGPGAHGGAPGVEIRRARREDIDALAALDLALPRHQALSPVFSRLPLPDARGGPRGVGERLRRRPVHDVRRRARRGGRRLGGGLRDRAVVDAHEPRAAREDRRSSRSRRSSPSSEARGVGRALGEAGARLGTRAGHAHVVTDWRMTNLLSSRTWPRLGFRPTFFRLFRAIA